MRSHLGVKDKSFHGENFAFGFSGPNPTASQPTEKIAVPTEQPNEGNPNSS